MNDLSLTTWILCGRLQTALSRGSPSSIINSYEWSSSSGEGGRFPIWFINIFSILMKTTRSGEIRSRRYIGPLYWFPDVMQCFAPHPVSFCHGIMSVEHAIEQRIGIILIFRFLIMKFRTGTRIARSVNACAIRPNSQVLATLTWWWWGDSKLAKKGGWLTYWQSSSIFSWYGFG